MALCYVLHFVRDSQARWHKEFISASFSLNSPFEATADAEIVVDN